MSTPRAPRKMTGGIDAQIIDLREDLIDQLEYQLNQRTNRVYWHEMDEISQEDEHAIDEAVAGAFRDIILWYEQTPGVRYILDHAQILIQSVVWAGMNVLYPLDMVDVHVVQVIDNALRVFNTRVCAHLRAEMIMANHKATLIQRNWRRCVTDPYHPACKRRLEYEFKECELFTNNVLGTV